MSVQKSYSLVSKDGLSVFLNGRPTKSKASKSIKTQQLLALDAQGGINGGAYSRCQRLKYDAGHFSPSSYNIPHLRRTSCRGSRGERRNARKLGQRRRRRGRAWSRYRLKGSGGKRQQLRSILHYRSEGRQFLFEYPTRGRKG